MNKGTNKLEEEHSWYP